MVLLFIDSEAVVLRIEHLLYSKQKPSVQAAWYSGLRCSGVNSVMPVTAPSASAWMRKNLASGSSLNPSVLGKAAVAPAMVQSILPWVSKLITSVTPPGKPVSNTVVASAAAQLKAAIEAFLFFFQNNAPIKMNVPSIA